MVAPLRLVLAFAPSGLIGFNLIMYFFPNFALLFTAVSAAAAVPVPEEDARHGAQFHVSKFFAQTEPHGSVESIGFNIKGSGGPEGSNFPDTKCRAAKEGVAYYLKPYHKGVCDNHNQ